MGTGGIGGYYGGRLVEAGADVVFVARGKHLQALQENGLKITSVQGDLQIPHVVATDRPSTVAPVDVIILGTKAWDVETAAEIVKPCLKPDGILVHFQNGVDIANRLEKFFLRECLIGGVAYGVVNIAAPGHVDHSTRVHSLTYGSFEHPPKKALNHFHALCQEANFDANLVDNIEVLLWSKYLFICAYSGVTSLLRLPIGAILADDDTFNLFKGCMSEIKAVADKKNIPLPQDVIEDRLNFAKSLEYTSTSSMQRDLQQGNRMELETLNGALSRMAKEIDVPTPINDFIYTSLKLHMNGKTPTQT